MSKRDKVFLVPQKEIQQFSFNKEVAAVFDDMVKRSIPFYGEIHQILLDLIKRASFKPHLRIYDIGCSTGTTIALINEQLKKQGRTAEFIGLDTSSEMLKVCRKKLKKKKVMDVTLLCADACTTNFKKADVVVMNYTLQFIPKDKRKMLLQKIFKSLNKGGILFYSEKLSSTNSNMHDLLTTLYYDFKRRNGYSELEIAQKREALDKVLVPLCELDHLKLLKSAGFKTSEMIFRWYNFGSFLGIKR